MKQKIGKTLTLSIGAVLSIALISGIVSNPGLKNASASVGNYTVDAATYYDGITATGGTQLLGQLHDLIVTTHKTYTTYTDCKTPSIVYETDPGDNSNYIIDFYSQNGSCMANSWGAGATGTWNREHVWCQSLSSGLWGESGGGSDLHHLRPLECTENSTRNNHPFGVVPVHDSSTMKYPKNSSGSYITAKVGGYYQTGLDRWEPSDESKGDVARILMYVFTHYNTYTNVGGTTNGSNGSTSYFGTLSITNVVSTDQNTTKAAWDLLLAWNKLDPVNQLERTRNEACAKFQGNRNPFIDNPSYADAIWGNGTVTPDIPDTPIDNSQVVYQLDTTVTPIATSSTYSSYVGSVASAKNGSTVSTADWALNIGNKQTNNLLWLGSNNAQKAKMILSNGNLSEASAIASATGLSTSDTYTSTIFSRTNFPAVNKVTLSMSGIGGTSPSSMWLIKSTNNGAAWSVVEQAEFATSYEFEFDQISSVRLGLVFNSTAYHQIKSPVITLYNEEKVVYVEDITVSPSTSSLTQGDTLQLTASILPSNASNTNIEWESNNEYVATVSETGLVTALHAGTAVISATTVDGGYSSSCTVTVASNGVLPTAINYTNRKTTFTAGELFSIGSGTIKITYSDSTTENVSLTSQGVQVLLGTNPWNLSTPLTSAQNGQDFFITFTKDGETVKTSKITVTVNTLVTSISFNTSSVTLDPGDKATLTPTVLPADATDKTFTWTSSNSTVATASGNQITALSGGSAVLTATANDGSNVTATVNVTVTGSANYEEYTDTLVRDDTGVTGTTYANWLDVEKESGAIYAGNSAGGNSSIQLRSANSNSGIVTTASGGEIKKVTVVWQSSTASGRTLDVYGYNSAFTSPTQLYSLPSGCVRLGSIVNGTSTELTITDSYTYVGVRSNSGAMYLTSISFDWYQQGTVVEADTVSFTQTGEQVIAHPNTLQLTTTTTGTGEATNGVVKYTTSNEYVATISSTGLVTSVGGGKATITATYGTGSDTIVVKVNESWNEISSEGGEGVYSYAATNSISVGDEVFIVSQYAARELTGISSTSTKYGLATTYSGSPSYSYSLTVCEGNDEGTYALKTNDDKYLSWSSGNSLNVVSSISNSSSWTIGFSDSNVYIYNAADSTRQLCLNNSSGTERFACYTDKTLRDGSSYPCIQLMKYTITYDKVVHDDTNNGNSAALNFAHQFLKVIGSDTCKLDGTTDRASLLATWNQLMSDSNSYYAAMTLTSRNMIKYATSDANGDTFQKVASLYDFIVNKYGATDWMNRNVSAGANKLTRTTDGGVILVITTALSLTVLVVAGYIFLKKKQEN